MLADYKIKNTKNKNQIEDYDHERLYHSILTACLGARQPEGQAEATANAACDKVEKWISTRPEITNGDIRRVAAEMLEKFDPEAAYSYTQQHLII